MSESECLVVSYVQCPIFLFTTKTFPRMPCNFVSPYKYAASTIAAKAFVPTVGVDRCGCGKCVIVVIGVCPRSICFLFDIYCFEPLLQKKMNSGNRVKVCITTAMTFPYVFIFQCGRQLYTEQWVTSLFGSASG